MLQYFIDTYRTSDSVVILDTVGYLISQISITRSCENKVILKENNIDFKLHDIRHLYVTILIEKEENTKDLQERLGHNSVTIIMW